MAPKDFTATILVDQTPEEAFEAINNVRGWWSEEVEGGTENLNDEFVFRVKDVHYSKQKLIEVVPGKRVVWLVTDSRLEFVQDKEEWTGTTIHFEISPNGNKTQVLFTHHGLLPSGECFDACSNAWTGYITGSLHDLIATGKGQPASKEN